MPRFPHGRIWLESNGSRMKEYGEQTLEHDDVYVDDDDKDLTCKVVFIEILPEKPFLLRFVYDLGRLEGDREWISLEVFTDGRPADDFLIRKEDGSWRVSGSSEGHRTGPASCVPYRFGACRLSESSGIRPESSLGSFEVILEVMERVSRAPLPERPEHHGWRVSRRDTVYDEDSKAGTLGYAVQPSQGDARRTDFVNPLRYDFVRIPRRPRYKVTFLYRTRAFLVAHRFIEEVPAPPAREGMRGATTTSSFYARLGEAPRREAERQGRNVASQLELARKQIRILRTALQELHTEHVEGRRASVEPVPSRRSGREKPRDEREREGDRRAQRRRDFEIIDLTEDNA